MGQQKGIQKEVVESTFELLTYSKILLQKKLDKAKKPCLNETLLQLGRKFTKCVMPFSPANSLCRRQRSRQRLFVFALIHLITPALLAAGPCSSSSSSSSTQGGRQWWKVQTVGLNADREIDEAFEPVCLPAFLYPGDQRKKLLMYYYCKFIVTLKSVAKKVKWLKENVFLSEMCAI